MSVKALAWPAASPFAKRGLTVKEMADAEAAKCTPSGHDVVHYTYRVAVTRAEANGSPRGRWHIAVLATAKNGDTTLKTKAADFTA
ncbi:DUF5707 domain-containing protein [Streptomyces sp. NBC_00252]|uniref:DUF5707 domain-containing protein n=1 Tax=Streptomyces sp. NBC_00252 TaxID=2975691 RepID=UPI002E2C80C8|nr:DUF5707 domain-containing protein [Streptomyces sp. NBC_00252]